MLALRWWSIALCFRFFNQSCTQSLTEVNLGDIIGASLWDFDDGYIFGVIPSFCPFASPLLRPLSFPSLPHQLQTSEIIQPHKPLTVLEHTALGSKLPLSVHSRPSISPSYILNIWPWLPSEFTIYDCSNVSPEYPWLQMQCCQLFLLHMEHHSYLRAHWSPRGPNHYTTSTAGAYECKA